MQGTPTGPYGLANDPSRRDKGQRNDPTDEFQSLHTSVNLGPGGPTRPAKESSKDSDSFRVKT